MVDYCNHQTVGGSGEPQSHPPIEGCVGTKSDLVSTGKKRAPILRESLKWLRFDEEGPEQMKKLSWEPSIDLRTGLGKTIEYFSKNDRRGVYEIITTFTQGEYYHCFL